MPLSDFPSKLHNKEPDKEPRKSSGQSRAARIISIGLIVALVALILVTYRVYDVYTNKLPSFEQLHNIEPSLKTQIYARDGSLLQEFYNENRSLTPYKDFPPHLVNMLVAVEDRQFSSETFAVLGKTRGRVDDE